MDVCFQHVGIVLRGECDLHRPAAHAGDRDVFLDTAYDLHHAQIGDIRRAVQIPRLHLTSWWESHSPCRHWRA